MVPKPPTCMQNRMTSFPKNDQVSLVFATTNPVTQEAELEVNRALTKPTDLPLALARGRVNNRAPIKMRQAKLTPKIRGGFLFNFSNTFSSTLLFPR